MNRFALLGICVAVGVVSSGCRTETDSNLSKVATSTVKQPDDPKAVALLKQSMTTYAALAAYKADGSFSMTTEGQTAPPSTRIFAYSKPNKFKVVSTEGGGSFIQTSISDGTSVLEFSSDRSQEPRKQAAPDSISAVSSMQMMHPMFCGTLLYQFFGGPSNYDNLVNPDKGPVTLGAEEKASTGEQAQVVKFYGQQGYGHVEALIGEKTGYVFRIQYDSEPLLKMMSDPGMKQQIKAGSESALNRISDPKAKAEAEKQIAIAQTTAPTMFLTTEVYSNISAPANIAADTFALISPKGTTPVESPGIPSSNSPLAMGTPAPEFSVTQLDGKTVSLSQLRGHPVMLDFWATWCPPCVASLPHTQAVFEKANAAGLKVLAISDEAQATVSKFIQDNKYTFPTGLDTTHAAGQAYKTTAIPTTVIIDAKGKLVAYIVGGGQDEKIKQALAKVGVSVE